MLTVTAANMIHSKILIFNDTFKHFEWYLANDVNDFDFQFLNRSRNFNHIDFGHYVAPIEKV